jgi:hypothetical protein
MPDISMCMTKTCPKRGDCYRYRAIPNGRRQSYGSFTAHSEDAPCRYFAQVRDGDSLLPRRVEMGTVEP